MKKIILFVLIAVGFKILANVLQLPEGGDFGALHCQPSTNFDRSTKLDLTTEPPLLGRCCSSEPRFRGEISYQIYSFVCIYEPKTMMIRTKKLHPDGLNAAWELEQGMIPGSYALFIK